MMGFDFKGSTLQIIQRLQIITSSYLLLERPVKQIFDKPITVGDLEKP